MSFVRPFCGVASLAVPAVAALVLLTPASMLRARAQAVQQAALSGVAKSDSIRASASQTTGAANATAVDQPGSAAAPELHHQGDRKSKGRRKVGRRHFQPRPVPAAQGWCQPDRVVAACGGQAGLGRARDDHRIRIVVDPGLGFDVAGVHLSQPTGGPTCIGSIQGPTSPSSTSGHGGEDAPEMMKRLQTSVIDMKPDLVIWQVGTNAVLRNLDPVETAKLVSEGVGRIQAAGADLVLVDPQYSPRVTERAQNATRMVSLLGKVAALRHVGFFPRFEVMREWHEEQAIPIDKFVIADGLHMNDWGYACFAQLLGDDIIKSVGQIKLGINVPSSVQTYRPM